MGKRSRRRTVVSTAQPPQTPKSNFPPRLILDGTDDEGPWRVGIVGVRFVTEDPANDPHLYPFEDPPTLVEPRCEGRHTAE